MNEVAVAVAGPVVKVILKQKGKPDAEAFLNKPDLGTLLDYEEASEAAEKNGKGAIRAMAAFLKGCGMPDKAIRALDPESIEKIIAALTPAKKK